MAAEGMAPGEGLGVCGQAGCVPAVVAGVLAGQVRGGAAVGQGAEPLGTVRACSIARLSAQDDPE